MASSIYSQRDSNVAKTWILMSIFFAVIIGYFLGIQKHFDKRGFGTIGLIAASVLHGLYDFFIFNADNFGIYGGAIASLIVGYYVSKKAIKLHQQDSPFKPDESQTGF